MNQNVVILLAEDNPGHAKLTRKHLKRAGLKNTIIHFNNGEELLNFLDKNGEYPNSPEIEQSYFIIMDLKMPIIDGFKALELLKSNNTYAVIPVVIYSTSDDPLEIYKCYQKGCNGYVVKPVQSKDFADFLKNLVSYLKIIQIPVINKNLE
ncbi:MAG: response regulator [Fidelibacterota bacterium]